MNWADSRTPEYYEAFCRLHDRYQRANAILVGHARIEPAHHILDVGAGTGRTADAVLNQIGESGRVVCVEPSASMREAGMRRVTDARVSWCAALPEAGVFDRIVCGAAIWQFKPLSDIVRSLAGLLGPRGALVFNIPALYLLEPDHPGGGQDPLLLALPAMLSEGFSGGASQPATVGSEDPMNAGRIRAVLRAADLRARSWRFRIRLSQDAYAEWLKIPAVSEGLFRGLTPDERAARIDAALPLVDRSSWKWERWVGWTAWKQ